jgi:hypothetical protein
MEFMGLDLNCFHFFVRYLELDGISSPAKLSLDLNPSACRSFPNQFYHHLMADQWSAPPVHTDMSKESVLDSIPLID